MAALKFQIKQILKMAVQTVLLPVLYRLFCIKNRKADRQFIVFADCHHNEMPENMAGVKKLLEKGDYKIQGYFVDYRSLTITKLLSEMLRFMELYSRARCVFICDNFLPVASCRKRKETIVVQLWHAAGALKKFGYDSADDIPGWYPGNVFKNYDLVTVSGKACVQPFASAMRLPAEKVKPLGISRTDRYFEPGYCEECHRQFYARCPDARNKRIALWAPTFRGRLTAPYVPGEAEIRKLSDLLGPEWMVLVKFHPHMHRRGDAVADSFSAEELLPVIDFLITDYSSIVFDYLLFEKPFAFFVPDLEQYVSKRGLYMPLEEFPGRITRNAEQLYQAIIEEWDNEKYVHLQACRQFYMEACDGKATKRILEEIGLTCFYTSVP